jgi:hypothetical protein
MDIGQRDDHALVGGDVHPGNTGHLILLLHRNETSFIPISTLLTRRNGKKPGGARGRGCRPD